MASLLYRYFLDMQKVMVNLHRLLKANGQTFLVIGDNTTEAGGKSVRIETTEILKEYASNIGWKLNEEFPVSVTKDAYKHTKNAITENTILWFKK
jgi:hypothetical protein